MKKSPKSLCFGLLLMVPSLVLAFGRNPQTLPSREEILSLHEAGKKRDVERSLSLWENRQPTAAEPYILRARFAFEKKHYKRTLSNAEKAIRRNPQLTESYYWKARALEVRGRYLDAANEYQAALSGSEPYEPARTDLERVQAHLRQENSVEKPETAPAGAPPLTPW